MTRYRKPLGWPKLMREKRLASGAIAYYWEPPTWAKRKGCPVEPQRLGSDYALAKKRCDEMLNPQFDEWRTGGASPRPLVPVGSFDWLVSVYRSHPAYTELPPKTKRSFDSALALVSKYRLNNGSLFGSLSLSSITPGTADRLFSKLKQKPGGGERLRTALLSMQVCRLAWKTARREKQLVPNENPFSEMRISYKPKETRPVTYSELRRFVQAADNEGAPSIGTAAMIAFFWLQRQTDIIGRLFWNHYRPADAPSCVRVFHHKTGELVKLPLYDEDGTDLWPELVQRLDSSPRIGSLIIMRDVPDRTRKIHLPWKEDYFRHRVQKLRAAAQIDPEAKFMGLRHGGIVEGADAGLTDAQLRAQSGHLTNSALLRYAQDTTKQRQVGARKRLDARTKRGNLSE